MIPCARRHADTFPLVVAVTCARTPLSNETMPQSLAASCCCGVLLPARRWRYRARFGAMTTSVSTCSLKTPAGLRLTSARDSSASNILALSPNNHSTALCRRTARRLGNRASPNRPQICCRNKRTQQGMSAFAPRGEYGLGRVPSVRFNPLAGP
jgi:hypothetical protein